MYLITIKPKTVTVYFESITRNGLTITIGGFYQVFYLNLRLLAGNYETTYHKSIIKTTMDLLLLGSYTRFSCSIIK